MRTLTITLSYILLSVGLTILLVTPMTNVPLGLAFMASGVIAFVIGFSQPRTYSDRQPRRKTKIGR